SIIDRKTPSQGRHCNGFANTSKANPPAGVNQRADRVSLENIDRCSSCAFQVSSDFGELSERSLEVFDDFGGDDIGRWEIRAVFQAFIFEPEDIEVQCVALD